MRLKLIPRPWRGWRIDCARGLRPLLKRRPSYMSRLPRNPYAGELTDYERYRLHHWILERRPRVVFEVGTGVGGSTFYIGSALQQVGGQLFTCDPLRRPPASFLRQFADVLRYEPLESTEMMRQLLGRGVRPDFIFFDGPEIPELALRDLQLLEPSLAAGTQFAMHDWHLGRRGYDGGHSVKAAQVRPYIENSVRWRALEVLRGDSQNCRESIQPYDSVGLCLYQWEGAGS